MSFKQSKEKKSYADSEGDDMYKEYLRNKSSGNFQFISYEVLLSEQQDTEQYYKSEIGKQNIAGKVGGVSNSLNRLQPHPEDGENVIDSHVRYKSLKPEDIVRDLEEHLGDGKIPPKIREAFLCIALINIREQRGATVLDLENRLYTNRNNAEKILERTKRLGLVNVCDTRAAKMYQYVLSNFEGIIDSDVKVKNREQDVLPNNISLLLAQELSNRMYVYHNIGLETQLNYNEDYESIKWKIPSQKNKQRVHTFKLDIKRNCTFILSPTGRINITIGCTLKPYSFHTGDGLRELFVTCGQILNLIQLSADNRTNVVPNVGEWNLVRFDYNKDISVLMLKAKYPSIQWNSTGVLKLKYLNNVFQIYSREMPYEGNVIRFEGHYITKKKRNLIDITQDILFNRNKHPFTTVEEMLTNTRTEMIEVF